MAYWAYLGGKQSQENTCFGLTEVRNGELIVKGAHLVHQEGSSASVEGDDDGVIALMMELDAEGISPEAMRCWVHSHPGTGEGATYLSATDESNIDRWLTGEYLISIVFDSKGENPYTRIDLLNPRISVVAKLEILFLEDDDLTWAEAEFKEKVRKKSYSSTSSMGTGFQGSPYGGYQGYDDFEGHGSRNYSGRSREGKYENGRWIPHSVTAAKEASSNAGNGKGSGKAGTTQKALGTGNTGTKTTTGTKTGASSSPSGTSQKSSSGKGGGKVVEISANDTEPGGPGNEQGRSGWQMSGWPHGSSEGDDGAPELNQKHWDALARRAAGNGDEKEKDEGKAGVPKTVSVDDTDPTGMQLDLEEEFEAMDALNGIDDNDIEILENIHEMEKYLSDQIDQVALKVQNGYITDLRQAVEDIIEFGLSDTQAWAELEQRLSA